MMTMNCNSIRDQLSAYLDGELASAVAAEVEQHLSGCEACVKELEEFEKLSTLARAHDEIEGRPPAWESIAAALDVKAELARGKASVASTSTIESHRGLAPLSSLNWLTISGAFVALAATFLIVAQILTPRHETHPTTSQAPVAAVNLEPVLKLFQSNASAALSALSPQFTLNDVQLAEVDAEFGRATYVSTAAREHTLPGDAMVASTKTFSFPFCQCAKGQCTCGPGGCQCVACVCMRPDGTFYLVLEHCKSQAITFGDLPVQLVKRNDREFQQVTTDGTETISFDRASGKVTVVGLRDESEIKTLLASL